MANQADIKLQPITDDPLNSENSVSAVHLESDSDKNDSSSNMIDQSSKQNDENRFLRALKPIEPPIVTYIRV